MMKMTRQAAVAGAILLASCAVLAAPKGNSKQAGTLPRYGMLVYSDLCIHPDSGEFGGQRITLQRFAEVDTVLYEYTAGGLSWPVVASDVTIDTRGQQFYFTVQPPDEDERIINAKVVEGGRAIMLDGGYCGDESLPMRLPLVKDFGRKAGSCRACPAPKIHQEKEQEPLPDSGSTKTAGL
ncbi:hypothetical protein [Duganella sp. sic0402]|uniref:hypothetical protein n=1 Tax=Duganella sp. sic0402 TaxID=2854786 RepID=UPI001E294A45|nr:hypothetical protein [Duganella sp. sic0402]